MQSRRNESTVFIGLGILSALLSFSFLSCSIFSPEEQNFITYRVYGCGGYCAYYTMKISRAGLVEYEGRKWDNSIRWFRELQGEYRISQDQVNSLMTAIEDLHIVALPDSFNYRICILPNGDTSRVEVSGPSPRLLIISTNATKKSLFDAAANAPDNFNEFIRRMMILAETSRWL